MASLPLPCSFAFLRAVFLRNPGQELAARQLVRKVCVDTYEREIERYGGPEVIDAIEEVFSVDSTATATLLAAHAAKQLTLDPLETAVFGLDYFLTIWGYDLTSRIQWLHERTTYDKVGSHAFRPHRKHLCNLLSPWDSHILSMQHEQRELLLALCAPYAECVPRVAQEVQMYAQQKRLWMPEKEILASLVHMHINRLSGIDRWQESTIMFFWRAALEGISLRPEKVV